MKIKREWTDGEFTFSKDSRGVLATFRYGGKPVSKWGSDEKRARGSAEDERERLRQRDAERARKQAQDCEQLAAGLELAPEKVAAAVEKLGPIKRKMTNIVTATRLRLDQLRLDGGTQPREALDPDLVNEYAEAMQEGPSFPPPIVFHDGAAYWLADGFHRIEAMRKLGREHADAEVRPGALRDAILFSVGVNSDHGKRRTNADKRSAVLKLLGDPEWSQWSDREIARWCRVSHDFVSRVRASEAPMASLSSDDCEKTRTYTTKHGTVAKMNTSWIGRRPEPEAVEPEAGHGVPLVSAPADPSSAPVGFRKSPERPAEDQIELAIERLEFTAGHIVGVIGRSDVRCEWAKRLRLVRTRLSEIIKRMEAGTAESQRAEEDR